MGTVLKAPPTPKITFRLATEMATTKAKAIRSMVVVKKTRLLLCRLRNLGPSMDMTEARAVKMVRGKRRATETMMKSLARSSKTLFLGRGGAVSGPSG